MEAAGTIGGEASMFTVDSGALVSLMEIPVFYTLRDKCKVEKLEEEFSMVQGVGGRATVIGTTHVLVSLGGNPAWVKFRVLSPSLGDILLGNNALKALQVNVNYDTNEVQQLEAPPMEFSITCSRKELEDDAMVAHSE